MNKGTGTAKKIRIEKFDNQLEKRHCRTDTGRRHISYKQQGRQNVDVKV